MELAEALADHGSSAGRAPRASSISSASGICDRDLEAEGERGALVHERGDRDHPAVAHAADDVLVGDPGLLDEELVELGLAGDLASGRTCTASCSMSIRK